MERNVSFAVDDIERIKIDEYADDEFAIARMGFLSTRPNSHGLIISDEVLRASAPSVLKKWVVADMLLGEPTTHTKNEQIVGSVPKDQDVEFVVDEDGYTRAYVDVVISKVYAKEFCEAFNKDNERSVSVEMKVMSNEDSEDVLTSFNIMGVTVLGKTVKPSCPQSNIEFVRFAEDFFVNHKQTALELFMKERNIGMAEKTYKIDKSKEAVSDTAWGDVDKTELRNKLLEADNKAELVKACYLVVEVGWEDAPSEHLKYPVMELKDDTLVYNRYALASALAYAKQENEQSVIDKVEVLYKELDIKDDSEGKGDKKMSEIEFSAVNIDNLWGLLWNEIDKRSEWDYCINGVYEEDNQKFAILSDREQKLYRLDFSLTEEGLVCADEVVEVKQEFTETENMKKFAEPENVADYRFAEETHTEEEKECEHCKELSAQIEKLEADIADKENIIMDKDAELDELRKFKADIEEKEKAMSVEAIMSEVKEYLSEADFATYKAEGMECQMSELDGWSNRIKALAFSAVAKQPKKKDNMGVWSFAAPVNPNKKSQSVWDRI